MRKISGMLLISIFLVSLLAVAFTVEVPKPKITGGKETYVIPQETVAPPVIDKDLLTMQDKIEKVIVVFKDFQSMREAEPLFSKFVIIHRFKLIPALLVEGPVNEIITEDVRGVYVSGYYANHIIPKPKIPEVLPEQDEYTIEQTTNETSKVIGATTFWKHGYNGSNIIVAVIDTGINASHPELQGKVIYAKSFVNKSYGYPGTITDPSDDEGHGTFVAGIIAGRGLDPRGVGMAPGALLMNAKVFSSQFGGAPLAGILIAVEWAVYGNDGIPNSGDEADVINMSLGGGESYFSPSSLIIWRAVQMGVVVVVSAGNEGDSQRASMSIGDPSDAPAAISVAAMSAPDYPLSFYSSIGPSVHLAVKPDIAAPSGIYGLYYETGGYTSSTWAGTSFSAPHVSGAMALIVQYLKDKGINETFIPEVARTALLHSASPAIGFASGVPVRYEDLGVGFGFVNLTNTWNLFNASGINSTNIPQWISILPTKIPVGISNATSVLHAPYFPYHLKRVGIGQSVVFNVSISLVKNTTMEVSITGNISTAIDLHSTTSFNAIAPVTYWEFNFTVKNVTPGYYSGYVVFNDTINNIVVQIPMEFTVYVPKIKVLFDLRHNYRTDDFIYGQYRLFARELVKNNASIDQYFYTYPELTVDVLSNYDLIFIPDATLFDFIPTDQYSINGEYVNPNFSPAEMAAIHQYIDNGGVVLLNAMVGKEMYDSTTYIVENFTNVNELLAPYGIKLVDSDISSFGNPVSADKSFNHALLDGITELPHYGASVKILAPSRAVALLEYRIYKVAAAYQNLKGGAMIVFGTNFIFDNWAFVGTYAGAGSNGANVKRLTLNLVNFVFESKTAVSSYSVPTTVDRGQSSTVEVIFNIENITAVSVKRSSLYDSMVYDMSNSGGTWSANVEFPIATDNALLFYVEAGGKYYTFAASVYVNPDETNAPDISVVGLSNNSEIVYSDLGITIKINITDESGVLGSTVTFASNITKTFINKTQISDRVYEIEVFYSNDTILNAMGNASEVYLRIAVSATDYNINEASVVYVFKIVKSAGAPEEGGEEGAGEETGAVEEETTGGGVDTTLIVAVVVILAILAVVGFLYMRKTKGL